jgi:hypothetical protein
LLAVLLLAGLVLSSYGVVYLYQEVADLQSQNEYLRSKLGSVSETVNIAVDFGNGTRIWYNDTYAPVGASVFNATYGATGGQMTTQAYTLGDVTGIFVTGILGVSGSASSYWIWYYFDNSSRIWVEGPVGADSYLAVQGGVYLWNFTKG